MTSIICYCITLRITVTYFYMYTIIHCLQTHVTDFIHTVLQHNCFCLFDVNIVDTDRQCVCFFIHSSGHQQTEWCVLKGTEHLHHTAPMCPHLTLQHTRAHSKHHQKPK